MLPTSIVTHDSRFVSVIHSNIPTPTICTHIENNPFTLGERPILNTTSLVTLQIKSDNMVEAKSSLVNTSDITLVQKLSDIESYS